GLVDSCTGEVGAKDARSGLVDRRVRCRVWGPEYAECHPCDRHAGDSAAELRGRRPVDRAALEMREEALGPHVAARRHVAGWKAQEASFGTEFAPAREDRPVQRVRAGVGMPIDRT